MTYFINFKKNIDYQYKTKYDFDVVYFYFNGTLFNFYFKL